MGMTGCGSKDDGYEGIGETVSNFLDENDSYYIIVNGWKFYAGDNISDLATVGYYIRDVETEVEIPADTYMTGGGSMVNAKGEVIFQLIPVNIQQTTISITDSCIGGITLNNDLAKADVKSAQFEVYGRIKLGSTEQDVTTVFGEPTTMSEADHCKVYRYESNDPDRYYIFTFDEKGKVSEIQWSNLVFYIE